MSEEKIFYYKFNKLNWWLLVNIPLSIVVIGCFSACPCMIYWYQMQILLGLFIISWAGWIFKYMFKHTMAIVTDESIKIDYSNPLKWSDVLNAEEKIVRCGFHKRKVLAINPKQNIDYKYSYLQKHNCDFGPFPIPLYGLIAPEDEEEIVKLVAEKLPVKKLQK